MHETFQIVQMSLNKTAVMLLQIDAVSYAKKYQLLHSLDQWGDRQLARAKPSIAA